MNDRKGSLAHKIIDFVVAIFVSLVIVLPIRYFVVQPFVVRGVSMEPNFHDREYLIIDELSYRLHIPQRGDVVVFHYPKNPSSCDSFATRLFDVRGTCKYLIKRIIGLPGERIEIRSGIIHIYTYVRDTKGFVLDERPYFGPQVPLVSPNEIIILGDTDYFVLGDNRDFSSDSRLWGPLPRNRIVGKTVIRLFPLGRLGILKNPMP